MQKEAEDMKNKFLFQKARITSELEEELLTLRAAENTLRSCKLKMTTLHTDLIRKNNLASLEEVTTRKRRARG